MKLLIHLLVITLAFSTHPFAAEYKARKNRPSDESATKQILKIRHRPTPLDILNAFDGVLPAKNIFIEKKGNSHSEMIAQSNLRNMQDLAKVVAKQLPHIIAVYEKSYPNALYFPMGRDAAYLADALDFFYLFAGQGKRVYRLRASGPTVKALDATTGPEFLTSNYFGHEPSRPHILIDNTSFSVISQSRILFNFGKAILERQGVKKADLYKYIAVSAPSGWRVSKNDTINERNKKSSFEKQTLAFSRANTYGSPLLYTGGFWHNSSTAELETLPSGELAGAFVGSTNKNDQLAVIGYIYEVMKVVSTPEFLDSVNNELKKLNSDHFFDPEDLIPLEIEKISDEETAQIQKLAIEKQMKNFSILLGSELSRRLTPKLINFSLYKPKNSANWSDLLTEREIEILKSKYSELVLANPESTVSMSQLNTELSKIIPAELSLNEKLDFIISRLEKLNDKQMLISLSLSSNGIKVKKWTEIFLQLGSALSSKKVDFVAAINTVSKSYLSGQLSHYDFVAISDNLLSMISKLDGNLDVVKSELVKNKKTKMAFYNVKKFISPIRHMTNIFLEQLDTEDFFVDLKNCKKILSES